MTETTVQVKRQYAVDLPREAREATLPGKLAKVAVGDEVIVTQIWTREDDDVLGIRARLTRLDTSDASLPFKIMLGDAREVWVYDVEKAPPADPEPTAEMTPEERIAALESQIAGHVEAGTRVTRSMEQAQARARVLESELTALRRAVSEKALELKRENSWCGDVEEWLREHDCPVPERVLTGTVWIQAEVRLVYEGVDADPSEDLLTDDLTGIETRGDVEVIDWSVDRVSGFQIEEDWD